MKSEEIAIADVLKHPIYGIISHQPDLRKKITERIRVRGLKGRPFHVNASDCEWASREEADHYWRNITWVPQVSLMP